MSTIAVRDYQRADAERLVVLANNKKVSRYLIDTFPYPYTGANAARWITTGSSMDGFITKVIEHDGELVGSVGIKPQTGWKSHVAEIGYWVGEAYWGQGIATAALRQMTTLAFGEPGIENLFAPVLAPNRASMKVLESCGYTLEDVLVNEVVKGGRCFDVHHYAKHRS